MNVYLDPSFTKYYQAHPLTLADIGASGGIQNHWKPAKKYLHVIGFEPDERSYQDLQKQRMGQPVTYLNTALYHTATTLDFHLARKQTTSSILKPNRAFLDRFPEAERFDILNVVKLKTDTLDHQLTEHKITDLDFMKIDSQGTELSILEGASHVLRNNLFGLEIEVEFASLYTDQPLFSEVESYVRKLGFQLFDLKPYYWKRKIGIKTGKQRGQIIFADALFMKDMPGIHMILNQCEDPFVKKSKVLRMLSICILYGYLDYALEILNETRTNFSNLEWHLIEKNIRRYSSLASFLPNFRGRYKIASLIHKMWRAIQPSHRGWATTERPLGNVD